MARTPVGCVHTFLQVVPQRKDHSDGVREAVELAVMSTVSHPNMLGIQVCASGWSHMCIRQ
eukprot:scaffold111689_cov27-Tisochrysis_lutea.AAC.1